MHAPFLVRSSTDVVSASIHMLMTHSFISASPHSHLSIVCMKLKSGCRLTYSDSIAIKQSSLLWLQMPFSRRLEISFWTFDGCSTSPYLEMHNLGVILDSTLIFGTYQVPTPNLLCPTSGTSLDFGHNFSNSGADTYFLTFITSARITAIESCLRLPEKTLRSLSMSRIQLPGSLHQHTLIYH